jgi:hypothetical protein
LFSTKDYFCGHIEIGTNYGYSCPAGYTLDLSDTPTCVKRDEIEPTVANTGYVHCKGRRRLLNGVSDGYYEPNDNAGLGPYFPDTLNPDLCVVGGANPTPTPTASVALTPTPTPTPTITPTPTLPLIDVGCLISAVDAQVETVTASATDTDVTIDISGLQGGTYGVGSNYYAFNIGSSSCRPCTNVTGTAIFYQRGTSEQFTMHYTLTSTGAVYLFGILPTGYVYDSNINRSKNCDGGIIGCLLKGTKITLADGSYKNIENLFNGDMLMSLNIDGLTNTDENAETWTSNTFNASPSLTVVRAVKSIINSSVYLINNTVVASAEHRHFIRRDSSYLFERSDSIRSGDYLLNEQGSFILINNVTVQNGSFETYTLDVEENDVYFANGILTHNKEVTPDQPIE